MTEQPAAFSTSDTMTILVVDDMQANRFAMSKMLEQLNVELLTASSANEGLRLLLNHKIDILLLDYSMPSMNGVEMAQIIHQQFSEPPPILFVTAHGTHIQELEEACYESGAIDFMEKPVKEHILLAKLRVLMSLVEQKERLRQMATTDDLTGIQNRFAFNQALKYHFALSLRQDVSMAVLALDLDDFKSVNDNYGHPAGDAVLKSMASHLKSSVRETDIVARLGGDEFVVMLTDIHTVEEAMGVAEKILEKCLAPVIYEGQHLKLKASIGIALSGLHASSPELLLKAADNALYLAKESGKGVVRVFCQSPQESLEFIQVSNQVQCHFAPVKYVCDNTVYGYVVSPSIEPCKTFKSFPDLFLFAQSLGKTHHLLTLTINQLLEQIDQNDIRATSSTEETIFFHYPLCKIENELQCMQLKSLSDVIAGKGFKLVLVIDSWQTKTSDYDAVCLTEIGAETIPIGLLKKENVNYIVLSESLLDGSSCEYAEEISKDVCKIAKALNCLSIAKSNGNSEVLGKLKKINCDLFY